MRRSGFWQFAVAVPILFLVASLGGCSSNNPVHTVTNPVPATITISPAPFLSMEIGTNQSFFPSVLSSTKAPITEPVNYLSSNTAVLTVANNGLACAGSWDSLSSPAICTPGPVGVSQVTANAQGVSSPPTTVYVHQHIDKVVVSVLPIPNQPPPTNSCYSVGQSADYQAKAYSNGVDITSTVGIFGWQTSVTSVASLNTSDPALLPGQVEVTAKVPGLTPLFATIGNVNSIPINFTTCPVQAITLAVSNATSTSKTITPTVLDTQGNEIVGVPLTWSSSNPGSVSVSAAGGATGSATGGGATIIASCTPPSCNSGILPSLPVYPENVVTLFVAQTGTTQSAAATVYVSSDSCGTTDNCFSTVVPITAPANTLGNFINLPATPNSMVFDGQGSTAYIGTDSGRFGTVGLALVDTSTNSVSQLVAVPGKVLAVSADGSKVIISDTAPEDGPNRVFVLDTATNTSPTFQITGATAAAFSPDSLKAYIAAGSNLYLYSKVDGLRTIPLSAPANDVSFLSEGAFAYVAGGSPSAISVWRTCDGGSADALTVPVVPTFIQTLPGAAKLLSSDTPDTFHMVALAPPDLDIISVNATPSGCTPPVADGPVASFNLGQGNFTPKQLIVSQDGSTAYVISNLNSILVFNIPGQTSSAFSLVGNPIPLSASLTPDGNLLYVGASDGPVHVVSTVAGGDIQQVTFPQSLCQNSVGQPFGITCNPDLVAVKP